MRKVPFYLMFMVLLSFGFQSCSSESTEPEATEEVEGDELEDDEFEDDEFEDEELDEEPPGKISGIFDLANSVTPVHLQVLSISATLLSSSPISFHPWGMSQ